jgi:hypothetical protein
VWSRGLKYRKTEMLAPLLGIVVRQSDNPMRVLSAVSLLLVSMCIGCQSVTEYSVPAGLDVFEGGQMPTKPMKLVGEIKDDGPLIEKSDIEAAMMKRAKKRGADFIILDKPVPAGLSISPFGGAQQKYFYRGRYGKYQN